MIIRNSEDTIIEETVTETPEIEELSDEAVDHVSGRVGIFALLCVFSPEGL